MKLNYVSVANRPLLAPTLLAWLARSLRAQAALGLTLSAVLLGRPSQGAELYSSTIYATTQAVAAITYADFDPQHAGSELACLMADGSIVELALGPAGWNASTIFVYPGPQHNPWTGPELRVSLRAGHVLTNTPGSQLVVSYEDQVYVVYSTPGGGWTNQLIVYYTGLGDSWPAAVGDFDPSHSGDEVFSIREVVFDTAEGNVYQYQNGLWNSNTVYFAEVGMDAAIGDSNPALPGNEIVVVTEMGPAYEILPPPTGGPGPWPMRTIWDDPANAGYVVKIGKVDPSIPGNQLVYGTRRSNRIMMSQFNGTNQHNVTILFTGIDPENEMLDVDFGQVFPDSPSKQIFGVDRSGSLYMVQQRSNQWSGSTVWRDTNGLYAVVVTNMLPIPGDQVVVGGASGTVALLSNPSPALGLAVSAQGRAILSWMGLAGVTYAVQTKTNLLASSPWTQVTNLTLQGGFVGVLSYTNAQTATSAPARFFRVKASS
jgi:hypothetical protein